MSETIIEKLLKGAEVEWKPIDEIFTLKNGYTPSKSVKEYWTGGTVPWFRMEDLRAGGRILNNSIQKVHINGVKGKLFPKNSIIMATTATIGEHALITVEHLCNQQFTNFVIKKEYQERLNIKFSYYYFFVIDKKAKDNISISSFPSVQMTKLKKWMFPIPPLSVQKEIVGILDAFTAHTAELTAELNERKKQYNYYRDKLLTFSDDEVEWKPLGEIAAYSNSRIEVKFLNNENYVGVDNLNQNRRGKVQSKFVPKTGTYNKYLKGDILLGNIRPNLKKIWFSDRTGGANGDVLILHITDRKVYNKYLFQILSDDRFFHYYIRFSKGAKMPRGDKNSVLKYMIPVPSIEHQKRIVSILDKFDILTTSIAEGLPREIELRNKQYEYYRDQLLNFPKPENYAIKHSPTNL